jgi:hypothetical protein
VALATHQGDQSPDSAAVRLSAPTYTGSEEPCADETSWQHCLLSYVVGPLGPLLESYSMVRSLSE